MIKKMLKWPMQVVALTMLGLLLLLSGCGSSSKYDEFFPTRIVSIGDFLSYQGTPSNGYADKLTVNDLPSTIGSPNLPPATTSLLTPV